MTDFLMFLNTADLDAITKIPGITPAIASNIIEARPFVTVNDCLKVHGMRKNLLLRMQSSFEEGNTTAESSVMLPAKNTAMPALIEKNQPAEVSAEDSRPPFWSRLGLAFLIFLRAFIRLIFTIAIIAGIGSGLYYGLPYINKILITPIEQNTEHVTELEDKIITLQTQLDGMNSRMGLIESSIETQTASLKKLEEMQTAIESELAQNNDDMLLELNYEVMTTRAFDMLGRARLYLAQSNFGLAKQDIQSARDLLAKLQAETNDALLDQVVNRLDLALGNLPAFPVVASGDLEIAWQLLMTGALANTVPVTPSPEPFPTFTPTAETLVISTSTPQPSGTIISSATP